VVGVLYGTKYEGQNEKKSTCQSPQKPKAQSEKSVAKLCAMYCPHLCGLDTYLGDGTTNRPMTSYERYVMMSFDVISLLVD
jgi:hypothetical protein